ncbi:hypothetical protein TNCV_658811 [Trichonephila clavipes]|nr:hypothetical protein TNCV_658811 [Trichonephila clavipes]
MEQQIADFIPAESRFDLSAKIRDDSHSHKVPQFDKFDEENEISIVSLERFETYQMVRTVPFALKGRELKTKLDKTEKEGIIEKVDSSEWATPVVPVVKPMVV